MTIPKINSVHGSDTRNIINRAIEVLNQQGKTIQDLVAEGQLTPEQYAELIKTINGMIENGQPAAITEEMLSQKVKEMMTGGSVAVVGEKSLLKENFVKEQVFPSFTTFYKPLEYEKFNATASSYHTSLVYNGETGSTAFIKVVPGEEYEVRAFGDDIDRFRIYGLRDDRYKEHFKTIGGSTPILSVIYTENDNTRHTKIKVPSSCNYIAVYLNSRGQNVQYNLDVYKPLNDVIKDVEEMKKSYEYPVTYIQGWTDANETYVERARVGTVAFIDVKPFNNYILNVEEGTENNRFRVYGMKGRDYKTNLENEGDRVGIRSTLYRDDAKKSVDIYVPEGINSIAVYLSNNSTLTNTLDVIEKTDDSNDKLIEYIEKKNGKRYFTLGRPTVYFSPENTINPTGVTTSDLLDVYEPLVSSEIVSKKILGKDGANNDLIEYTYKKPSPNVVYYQGYEDYPLNYTDSKKMKILIIGGAHGDEKTSQLGLSLFLKELVENTADENLAFIRNNAVLKVIPMMNPTGIDANTRNNHAGSDLNRGYRAQVQEENKIVSKWIEDNQDAIALLDYHDSSRTVSFWPAEENEIYHELFYTVMANVNDKWSSENSSINNPVGEMVINPTNTNSQAFAHDLGMLGVIVETSRNSSTLNGGTNASHNAAAVKYGNDLLINTIIAIMNYYS